MERHTAPVSQVAIWTLSDLCGRVRLSSVSGMAMVGDNGCLWIPSPVCEAVRERRSEGSPVQLASQYVWRCK
jgi:hypothetical protein